MKNEHQNIRPGMNTQTPDLNQDWQHFQNLISSIPNSQVSAINELYSHAVSNRGKRLRASIVILMSKALGYQGKQHALLACIVELLHTATLIHDDIIDNAKERSSHTCAHIKFGNTCAVLGGDYLYGLAFNKIAELENNAITSCIATATTKIIEGELMQLHASEQQIISEEHYLTVISLKTACLFQVCSEAAAILANMPHPKAYNFGQHFGMAYQMLDDLQDYLGTADTIGKAIGNDFKEQKMTLPLIIGIKNHPEILSETDLTKVNGIIKNYGGFDITAEKIVSEVELAKTALSIIPISAYTNELYQHLEHLLTRTEQMLSQQP